MNTLPLRQANLLGPASLPVAPVAIVATFLIAASVAIVGFRLRLTYPISAWEAGIVTDAWRLLGGQGLYQLNGGHATHMYGPLTTVLLAGLLEFTGPSLWPGRLVSVAAGIATVLLVASLCTARGSRLTFVLALALLMITNSRTGYYFAETRPDMMAAFFGTLSLIAFYRGIEAENGPRRLWMTLAGCVLVLVAILFKQTAAAVVAIPLLALLATFDRAAIRDRWILASIPAAAVMAVLGTISLLAPGLWHAMIEVPAQYGIPAARMLRMAIELLATLPLFTLALVHWLLTDAVESLQAPRTRWLLASLVCLVPASIMVYAKAGGAANCLIPALLAIAAFCAWRVPVGLALLQDASRPLPSRIAAGLLLSVLMFAQAYPLPGPLTWPALVLGHGTDDRVEVIADIRSRPGRIISPDDPTIALMAKGYAGRTAVFEADMVKWDRARLTALLPEIDAADCVVVMKEGPSSSGTILFRGPVGFAATDAALLARGFTPSSFHTTVGPVYTLWCRSELPPG